MHRWKITISYKGTDFCGWQRQEPGVPSVQQVIEDAVFAFCGQRVTLHVAGRTDAGVHARGQVAHLDLAPGKTFLEGAVLVRALNALLRPAPVAVLAAQGVDRQFHARFGAINKLYSYTLVQRAAPPVLERDSVLHVRKPMDIDAMRAGAAFLIGAHDFTTFRASGCQARSPLRTLDRLDIRAAPYDDQGGERIVFFVEARSFLHHQVRNMVGSLLLVGEGAWRPEAIADALAARDRRCGGPTAPAHGLCLERVDYPPPPYSSAGGSEAKGEDAADGCPGGGAPCGA